MVELATASRGQRRRIVQHDAGGRKVSAKGVLVADKTPKSDDVAIASRLLRAFRAADPRDTYANDPKRRDLWTIIGGQQGPFLSILRQGTSEDLAAYLCNVSRHDASIGITQGNHEHQRIVADESYRDFLALMTKDKLVSLAEGVGSLAVENPEQGSYGVNLHVDPDELVVGISRRLGIDIAPPDIDGGLFKLKTNHGLFGERDANAIFTAWILMRAAKALNATRICEIGAGSGRVAYWAHRLGLTSHTIIDLPHVNVVQGYYLLKAEPEARIVLYGEEAKAGAEVTIWPNHALDELPSAEFDLVLNQDSMPEMSSATVRDYLEWIRRSCRGAFLSINHESKPVYAHGLTHVSVPEAVDAAGGLTLRDRYPYWLRKGYVVELYVVGSQDERSYAAR